MWGYGTVAVFIISLSAVLGGLFVPCMSEGVYDKTIQTMIALAVATLTGDAVLHLLPQAVGLHSHDSSGHSAHTPTSPEMAYVWKCLVVQMAIYVFFVFEQLTSFTKCGHYHNDTLSADVEMTDNGHQGRSYGSMKRGSFANGNNKVSHSESKSELTANEAKAFEAELPPSTEDTDCCVRGCNPVAMMIILGDSLHNFGDGLAIGAAFSLSIAAGLSTSIAVLCHEIPHELGDLAVLIKQGIRLRTALLMNMMCACSAFLGLWVGIPLGQTETVREWIFAAVAGMFLYVGLVDMLPMLHQYDGKATRSPWLILQNIGSVGNRDYSGNRRCPLFLFGAYEMVAVCQAGRGGTDLTESVVMASLKMAAPDSSNLTLTENDLEVILESIHDSYAESTNAKCFSVESVFDETVNDHEAGADDDELQYAAQAVVAGLLQGYCIGEPTLPSTTDFTEAIFDTFATFGVITEEEFAHMLIDLGIGGEDGHDHDHAQKAGSI
eukprot:XP_011667477.1 PREDICTED: zinc transporter ZIP12-like [Strongylocentrotus purpuratus]